MERKEVRVRKARRASRLACGHWANIGNQIVSVNGHRFICISCALKNAVTQKAGPSDH